jgi:glycerophosphoryl diester phosphodiesterase
MRTFVVLIFCLGILGACDERQSPTEVLDNTDADAAAPSDVDRHPNWAQFPDAFQVVLMRSNATDPPVEGNSLDGFEAAFEQGIKFVEADFMQSKDGALIAAHHDSLSGDCGRISRQTLEELRDCRLSGDRRVGALEDLLGFGFEAIYIDLKASSERSSDELFDVVEAAVDVIEDADRADSAVLMVYDVDEAVAELLDERGIRAGLKGYPGGSDGVPEMLETAASYDLEMMCINASNLTPELVHEAARLGIWQLPWDHARRSNIPHWQDLIESGIGGLIVDTDSIVPETSIGRWRDVRRQVD